MPSGVYKHKPHQGLQKGHKLGVGRTMSDGTKRKLSVLKKGKPLHPNTVKAANKAREQEWYGKWNKGIVRSEDVKRRISGTLKKYFSNPDNRTRFSGENSHFWVGGVSSENIKIRNRYEYRQWRSDVFTRDDFTCQECGERGGKLNVDHIKPFSVIIYENDINSVEQSLTCEELWNINNGRTLCVNCHKKTDTYGKGASKYPKKTKDSVDR